LGEGDEADDCDEVCALAGDEGFDGGVEVSGEGVVGVDGGFEAVDIIVSEDISGLDVKNVGSSVAVVAVEIVDLEVGAIAVLQKLDEHDLSAIVFGLGVGAQVFDEWGVVGESGPVDPVQQSSVVLINVQYCVIEVGWVLELDHMQVVLELDVHQLVLAPEFGVDGFEELDNLLVVLGFGDVRGGDEEGDPVVAAVAVQVGGQKVIPVDEVVTTLVDVGDDVDLVVLVHKGCNAFVG